MGNFGRYLRWTFTGIGVAFVLAMILVAVFDPPGTPAPVAAKAPDKVPKLVVDKAAVGTAFEAVFLAYFPCSEATSEAMKSMTGEVDGTRAVKALASAEKLCRLSIVAVDELAAPKLPALAMRRWETTLTSTCKRVVVSHANALADFNDAVQGEPEVADLLKMAAVVGKASSTYLSCLKTLSTIGAEMASPNSADQRLPKCRVGQTPRSRLIHSL